MNKFAELYEHDFNAWIHNQISLLKAGKTNEIDIEHLIEELEDMGKSNLRELESRFIILIAHLLKWQFQLATLETQWQDFEGKSWRKTIIEQRAQLLHLLRKVPSLKQELQNAMIDAYPHALDLAIDETGLPESTFPKTCPYTIEQLLDKYFYPRD
ncbi:hypothetical protein THII_1064 [Thioploca ingrica]|uniref:DUF29 domain-containing protein n=1 Tax=Thioploca ingrica TaxID=40754 RepID=A0A090BUM4_9GAMM|nr:hypothetical protein THII_1064 [Thioploca ingrica]